ncbi:MAG: HYR domain-containing protein, partial [Bacteroidota bacterium]
PAITCPGNQTVASNAACEATPADYTTQAQISDNCTAVADISVTQDAMVATPFTVGPNTVTLTATDQSGNQTSCTFVVTVVDRQDPVITNCPTDADVAVDADCNYVVPDLTVGIGATDNCSAPGAIDLAQTPVPGTVRTGAGTNVLVTLTATDEAGNTANCTYTLTLRDETPPEITCPIRDDQTLSNDPNGNCTFILPDFRGQVQRQDNCSNRNQITLTQNPPGGTAITEPGTVEIVITATDEAGNSSTCTIEQRVLDRDPPQLICGQFPPIPPNPGTCDYTIPDVIAASIIRDNCGTDDLASVTQSPAVGTTFTGFFQNVTVTATDASGNSNICVTTLLPGPPPAPEIICPADQQLTADGNCRAPLPDYTGQATTDGCGPITVTQQPGPGTSIADGTTVTLTARNSVGVAVSCTFRVDVLDQSPPSVTCPGPQTIAVDGTCAVPLPDYTSAAATQDNCSPERGDVNLTQTPAAGTMYDITDSPVTVTLTATDAAGNASTCNFQVELMDNQPPMI